MRFTVVCLMVLIFVIVAILDGHLLMIAGVLMVCSPPMGVKR